GSSSRNSLASSFSSWLRLLATCGFVAWTTSLTRSASVDLYTGDAIAHPWHTARHDGDTRARR
ncbi:MAG: hypothetical protein ABWZ15_13885, partial [Acidimicrobiia bacterium]